MTRKNLSWLLKLVLTKRMKILYALCVLVICNVVWSYPPAPPVTIKGKVRGEFGFDANYQDLYLVLYSSGEEVSRAKVEPISPSINYEMKLPLDLNPIGDGEIVLQPGDLSLSLIHI